MTGLCPDVLGVKIYNPAIYASELGSLFHLRLLVQVDLRPTFDAFESILLPWVWLRGLHL